MGTTKAGGLELPGEVAGLVALDELVIHGWDVARSSGQRPRARRYVRALHPAFGVTRVTPVSVRVLRQRSVSARPYQIADYGTRCPDATSA